jgi:hypothetical protein
MDTQKNGFDDDLERASAFGDSNIMSYEAVVEFFQTWFGLSRLGTKFRITCAVLAGEMRDLENGWMDISGWEQNVVRWRPYF